MFRTFVRQLVARRRRVLGMSVAVVLGVTFLVAAMTFGSSMRDGLERSYRTGNEGTDVVVRSATSIGPDQDTADRPPLPAELRTRLSSLPGVADVAGTITAEGQILTADGRPVGGGGPPTIAAMWISTPSLNAYRVAEGRAPQDRSDGEPYEVVIDRTSATTAKLTVGSHTRVVLPNPVDVEVVGIVTFGSMNSQGPITFAGFAPQASAALLQTPSERGTFDEFLIAAAPGADRAALRTAVNSVLPPGVEAITGAQLSDEQIDGLSKDFMDLFEMVLMVFGAIAVVVAAVSIHNAFSIVVAQRSREAALMRAVGASRRQVLGGVLAEAGVVGLASSVVGIAAGAGLASLVAWGLTRAEVLDLSAMGITLAPATLVTAFLVGVGVTMLAGFGPAWRSSRTPPIAALRTTDAEPGSIGWLRPVLGAALLTGGAAAIVASTRYEQDALSITGLGSLAVLAGAIVVGPVVARPLVAALSLPAALTQSGRLARANALRNPRRSSTAAAALMLGTAVVVVFATFGASIKSDTDRAIGRATGTDLVISDPGQFSGGLSDQAIDEIAALPSVSRTATLAIGTARVAAEDQHLTVLESQAWTALYDIDVTVGTFGDLGPTGIAVSDVYAREHTMTVGDEVPVAFADGSRVRATVNAIYSGREMLGDLVVDRAMVESHLRRLRVMAMIIDVADHVTRDDGLAAVNEITTRYATPRAQTQDQYAASMRGEIDDMLTFVYALLGIAVVIAVMSVATTLSLAVHERHREIGLMRAIGQNRTQAGASVRWESLIVSLLGAVLGGAVGLFLGWGLIGAMKAQEGFGTFTVPTATLLAILGLAVLAGVLAAWRPAGRAARLDILAAISGRAERGRRNRKALA